MLGSLRRLTGLCVIVALTAPAFAASRPRKKRDLVTATRRKAAKQVKAPSPAKVVEEPHPNEATVPQTTPDAAPTENAASAVAPVAPSGPPAAGVSQDAPAETRVPVRASDSPTARAPAQASNPIPVPIASPQVADAVPRHRYAYFGAGVLLLGGVAFGYTAQGGVKRAQTISNARQVTTTLEGARATAATADVFYGLAALTAGYALVLEFLPPQVAERASLNFHF